jgi:nucleotide-binding universal stress UspA family protein
LSQRKDSVDRLSVDCGPRGAAPAPGNPEHGGAIEQPCVGDVQMFKHLLVPVDGSELTERAIAASVALAQQLGASITGFVAEPMAPLPTPGQPPALLREETLEHDAMTVAHARELLTHFEAEAAKAGVPFTGRHAQVPRVDRAIIAAAESQGCDMIVMVTHGRGAFGEFLFGSQTKAVLAGSKLPLLVLH